ncbi:Proline iminopeptidase [Tieghemostelium lacteum]|uniref:Proline iminopeptidase n=1 Tax=Tieghemostelium lacteum TaxID=361077 RepID=A0A151Z505_TIELA|nr:Proline iminopeptidase [Tieghemostelium lacteum]|eukprot:KYQ89042.1 Proline iminopeptidase [Tieghemostelium lacteum]
MSTDTQPTSFNDIDIPNKHWNNESVQKWCKFIGIPEKDIIIIRNNEVDGFCLIFEHKNGNLGKVLKDLGVSLPSSARIRAKFPPIQPTTTTTISTELKYSPGKPLQPTTTTITEENIKNLISKVQGIDDSVAESITEQLFSNFINQIDLILQTLNDIELRPKYFPNWKDGQIFQLRNILESPGFTEFIDMTYNLNPTYKSIIEEEEDIVLDLNMPYEGRDNEIEDIVEVYKNNNIPAFIRKVKAIQNYRLPLVTVIYYITISRITIYVIYYAYYNLIIIKPLQSLLNEKLKYKNSKKTNVKISLNEKERETFLKLKQLISNENYLFIPNFKERFYIETDASEIGIGYHIYQLINNEKRIILFNSKKFSPAETHYPVMEKELLSIVKALKQNYYMLFNYPITIYTDHKNLIHKDTGPTFTTNARLIRWMQFIELFNPDIKYIKGENNVISDGLSRYTINNIIQDTQNSINNQNNDISSLYIPTLDDDFLINIIKEGYNRDLKEDDIWYKHDKNVKEINKLYYIEDKIILPINTQTVQTITKLFHDGKMMGHMSYFKTIELMKRYFYTSKSNKTIKNYIESCHICKANTDNHGKELGLLKPLPIPNTLFDSISMDYIFVPEITNSENKYNRIWIIIDRLSKYHILIPTHSTYNSKQTTQIFMDKYISKYGVPTSIYTDNDPQFISKVWEDLMSTIGSKHNKSIAYHQQANGQAERSVRTISNILRKLINDNKISTPIYREDDDDEDDPDYDKNDWVYLLPFIEFAINNSKSNSTKYTPFNILYGIHPNIPLGLIKRVDNKEESYIKALFNDRRIIINIVKEELKKNNIINSKYYNNNKVANTIAIGDMIYVKRTKGKKKLDNTYYGPFKVTDVTLDNDRIYFKYCDEYNIISMAPSNYVRKATFRFGEGEEEVNLTPPIDKQNHKTKPQQNIDNNEIPNIISSNEIPNTIDDNEKPNNNVDNNINDKNINLPKRDNQNDKMEINNSIDPTDPDIEMTDKIYYDKHFKNEVHELPLIIKNSINENTLPSKTIEAMKNLIKYEDSIDFHKYSTNNNEKYILDILETPGKNGINAGFKILARRNVPTKNRYTVQYLIIISKTRAWINNTRLGKYKTEIMNFNKKLIGTSK